MNIHRLTAAAAALLLAAGAPAWAINKCTGPTGKTVFQDMPCAGQGAEVTVNPASGYTAPPQAAASDAAPVTEAQRINANIAKMERDMRKRELESINGPIGRIERAIDENTARCEQEQATLQARKSSAYNNLAGAAWEQSISQEMQAAAHRCDTRSQELYRELERYRREYAEFKSSP